MALDTGIGASAKRREDVRFLTGKGRYTDDLNRPGQAYVHFLRSDVAHGRIRKHRHARRPRRCRACSRSSPRRTSRASAAFPAAGWSPTATASR